MLKPADSALLTCLRDPAQVAAWAPAQCAQLLHEARSCGLLGRVAQRVQRACASAQVAPPTSLQGHFESALRLCRTQQAEVRREASFLREALRGLPGPVIVLKGAAYVLADLPAAEGRLFSDVDLMVPKHQLAQAESQLMLHGWMGAPKTDYDEHYYRQWMHELPPMTHVHRQTTLDLHHTLLPETARLRPDAAALCAQAVPIEAWPGLHVLCPADMVLHSLTHLFMNEETRHALRDLCDVDALLRHFGPTPGFWAQLQDRARLHQLSRPLYYGLRYASQMLLTPVPGPVIANLAPMGSPAALRPLMDALWQRAFDPAGRLNGQTAHAVANAALYLRGHWLRMPAGMLLKHLSIKALRLHEKAPPAAELNG